MEDTPSPKKDPSQGVFIGMTGLPLSVRLLTITGYLGVLGLLAIILLVELAGKSLATLEYTQTGSVLVETPLFVLAVSIFFFTLGWAFLMTGAAAACTRVFLPVLALLGIQLFLSLSFETLAPMFMTAGFMAGILIIYALTSRTRFWRDFPAIHFFIWFISLAVLLSTSFLAAKSDADVAKSISANLSILLLLTMAFWVILGLSIVDLGLGMGRFFTRAARRFLPDPVFYALTIFTLLFHPAVAIATFGFDQDGIWIFDLVVSLFLALMGFLLWPLRRWNIQTASVLLALSFASPVIMLGLSLGLSGYDFTEFLLASTGIFPPLILFAALTTYNLLTAAVTFSSVDGRILPRSARILMYFGIVILVVTFMLFMSNERVAATGLLQFDIQGFINNLFVLSALILGIPYILWLIWKRQERLTGVQGQLDGHQRWTWLESIPGKVWLILGFVMACLGYCLFLVLSLGLAKYYAYW